MPDPFLTPTELYRITGSRKPKDQVSALVTNGFNPWVHPKTGVPCLYRDVFKANQTGHNSAEFTMNLDAINAT
jgi:hypothetical protein